MTRWVLNEALRQQRVWRDEGIDLTHGGQHLRLAACGHSSSFPATVAELTETWGTAPDRLTLELTESALIEAGAADILERLHDLGQRVSVDDFGTGYSSLAYLQRLPVDEIKVDRSFVTGLIAASDDEVIVRSTIDLAHNLGLTVVAEGVEDETRPRDAGRLRLRRRPGVLLQPAVPRRGAQRMAERLALPGAAGSATGGGRLTRPSLSRSPPARARISRRPGRDRCGCCS